MDTLLGALATGGAAATSISLWTFRVALAGRGRRVFSAVIAGIEAVLFVVVFTGLVANLGDPVRLVAYALGVALGTLLGLVADDRLSSGHSEVRLVVVGDGAEALATLRGAGWPATSTPGSGRRGRRPRCSWWWTTAGATSCSRWSVSSNRPRSSPSNSCVRPVQVRCRPGSSSWGSARPAAGRG